MHVVDKAYDLLKYTLGKNWQRRFKVWDMCCGVGNLEVKHSHPRNVFMSTLNDVDVDIMVATKTCVAAERFQYDYLNDDVTELGTIDYSLTNKIPQALRDAIAAGERIVVLINPPYAEAMNAGDGVAETAVGRTMGGDIGYANRELFIQFLMRIQREMPNAVIAMFSKLKYVNAPNFSKFRDKWFPKYLGGFVVPSRSFDGLTGEFPIGFLVWDTAKKRKGVLEIETEVLDRDAQPIGAKRFYDVPQSDLINSWIKRAKPNATPALPLVNAFDPKPGSTDVRGKWWADGGLGGMICKGSDFQNSRTVGLMSSGYASAGGILVTEDNLRECAVVFTARRLVKQTWLNDRDQFLAPTTPIPDDFANDCLVWMLFNTSNSTVAVDGISWDGKTWSLDNHFLPYTEKEVGADGRFKSDFMSTHLATLKLSKEAKAVLAAGKIVWRAYFERKDEKALRDRFRLGRPDVGWLQIRNVLNSRIATGTIVSAKPKDVEPAYKALGDKILPEIYAAGLLKA